MTDMSAGFLRGDHNKRCYNKETEMRVRQNKDWKTQGTAVRGQKALAGGRLRRRGVNELGRLQA